MNELQILSISGVNCYEENGTAYLKLEDVARGLGFTQDKNGVEYIRWDRISGYLNEMNLSPLVGKNDFIPENIFYRLAMKAKNETAERFQAKVADEIIPTIRRTGGYVNNTDLFINTYFDEMPDEQKEAMRGLLQSIEAKQKKIGTLEKENNLLAQKNLEWADRPLINALVRAYATSIYNDYSAAWRDFKKELLYRHSINLNARITNHLNNTGRKPKTLDMIDDSELSQALSTAVSLCRDNGVNISDIIEKKSNMKGRT